MSLAPGSSLLNFRLADKIGEGGMGEVWKATDTTLGRDVAIKILPAEFAADAERLARFEREAKVLASLNHPNIAGIHGLHEAGGVRFLVMELVPGEDLAERLKKGSVPFSEAVDVARQIADALEAAHDQGVIHRDLKPANVRITPGGKVKVLDFGLAKALESATTSSPGRDSGMSPTITSLGTVAGVILGTAAYMSPEQARGKPVDKRADIWAFGCVLFEMLSGVRPFEGETISDTLAAVLAKDANWSALPATTPSRLRELLQRCLEKDVKKRLRDIHDVRIELDRISEGGQSRTAGQSPSPVASRGVGSLLIIAFVSVVLGAVATYLLLPKTVGRMETAPIRATIELPAPLTLAGVDRAIALSPDGTQLALVAHDSTNNTSRIFVRPLSRLDLRALAGTEDASYPFWSPDGKSLGFFAGGKLKRIELAEGIVRAICDAPQGRGGSWSSRGFIVFAPGAFGALFQVPDGGGTPVAVTKLRTESETDRLPRCLPDGRRFLYYSSTSMKRQDDGVYVFDPETNASRLILKSQTEAVYVDPGFLAFVQDENLMLQPFDVKRLELTGTARPIASGVQYDINRGYLNLGLTPGGRLVYQEVLPAQRARLVWIDRAGVETAVSADPLPLEGVSLAPDGKKAAVTVPGDHGETRLAILDLERGIRMPFGEPNANSNGLIWSPDGRSLAFATQLEGGYQIGVQALDEGSKARMLTSAGNAECLPGSFTLDGRELLFEQRRGPDKIGFLMMADVDGHTPPHDILGGSAGRFGPQLSPDARWTGFEESVEGGLQLSIVPFPAGGAPTRVTTTGVRPTQWGWLSERELWWTSSDNHVWSATVTTKGADAEIGSPRPLVGGHALLDGMQVFSYSRARDRFLAAKLVDSARSAKLVLVTDWKTGLSAEGPHP